ncbi:unnamed protein product, partial [marine sediment metagenome]
FWESIEHDEYREPFLGGGAVFWAKNKVKYNWLNDIDKELIDTLIFIKNKKDRDRLIRMLKGEKEALRQKYNFVKNLKPRNKLEKVYKFYYLNRTSYSGKMRNPTWGYRPKRSLPPFRWKERIIPCGEKLQNVKLTSIDFDAAIKAPPKGKRVLMFLDPPYFLNNQRCHYKHPFTLKDHLRLVKTLKDTRFAFFLTYDDCPKIRDLYNWAHVYELAFYYRLNNSKDSGNKRKIGNEIVITNYKIN